jgi:hypothetical protein
MLDRYRGLFTAFSIPQNIWEAIATYIFQSADCYAANAWIFESESPIVNSKQYASLFPQYDWPLLTRLEIIVSNEDDLASGKMTITAIPTQLRHSWLGLARTKIPDQFGRKDSEKRLAALIDGDASATIAPTVEGIDQFVDLTPVFAQAVMRIPDPLPEIPHFDSLH